MRISPTSRRRSKVRTPPFDLFTDETTAGGCSVDATRRTTRTVSSRPRQALPQSQGQDRALEKTGIVAGAPCLGN